jgi:pimeloyl-ACP methyl ester carboxylesterase
MRKHLLIFALALLFLPAAATRAAGQSESHSKFAQFEGNKVHYETYGKGSQGVVFIHGWSCDATFWRLQLENIGSKTHAIALDLPGHGQSDKPKLDYTMDFYARSIDAVLRDAGLTGVVLVGHSNGVPVIRQFYRKYPQKTRGFVAVDGMLRPIFTKAQLSQFIEMLKSPNYQEVAGGIVSGMVQPVKDPAMRAEIKSAMLATPQYVSVSEMEAVTDPSIWTEDKITVPMLVIVNKVSWPADYEQFVRSLGTNVDYQQWDGVSHFIMMDKPAEFNETLLNFLSKNRLIGN